MRKLTFALVAAFAATALPAFAQSGATTTRTMPACSVGDAVVWENTKTKVYHLQGDAYYGTTKHGRYACRSAAESTGYHASGSHAAGTTNAAGTSGGTPTLPVTSRHTRPVAPMPAETAAAPDSQTATPASSKHHKRHRGMASPGPMTATPLPAATQ